MKSLFKVNGKDFFSIGGQVNNSSSMNAQDMEHCYNVAKVLGMNTIASSISWELFEPCEGEFDYKQIDMVVEGARRNGLKLVLLWFATWKNGNSYFVPEWVKSNGERFKYAKTASGVKTCSISPLCEETQKADKKAFCEFCGYVKKINTDETVIGIQVENEPGLMGTPMDYSKNAIAVFENEVPSEVAKFCGKTGSWKEVFSFDAEEFFTSYHIAKYIDDICIAGKEILSLPMYVNVWLGEMHNRFAGIDYPAGGAVSKTFAFFKAMAKNIDAISPDVYIQDSKSFEQISEVYSSEGNIYYMPELMPSGLGGTNALKAVAEQNLSSFHFFGMDLLVGPGNTILPHTVEVAEVIKIAGNFKPLIEKYQGGGKLYAVAQYEGMSEMYIDFGDYVGSVRFAKNMGDLLAKQSMSFMDNKHFYMKGQEPRGKGLICYDNGTFYVSGSGFRLFVYPKGDVNNASSQLHASDFLNTRAQAFLSVEEGSMTDDCTFIPKRRRNGDEVDVGFWVTPDIGVLKIKMNVEHYNN